MVHAKHDLMKKNHSCCMDDWWIISQTASAPDIIKEGLLSKSNAGSFHNTVPTALQKK